MLAPAPSPDNLLHLSQQTAVRSEQRKPHAAVPFSAGVSTNYSASSSADVYQSIGFLDQTKTKGRNGGK